MIRTIANYKLAGLGHLRILLVDQHVEGDEDSALQWLLRADVERTSLLEDEARLTHYLVRRQIVLNSEGENRNIFNMNFL